MRRNYISSTIPECRRQLATIVGAVGRRTSSEMPESWTDGLLPSWKLEPCESIDSTIRGTIMKPTTDLRNVAPSVMQVATRIAVPATAPMHSTDEHPKAAEHAEQNNRSEE
jgi:hypothetical protein